MKLYVATVMFFLIVYYLINEDIENEYYGLSLIQEHGNKLLGKIQC